MSDGKKPALVAAEVPTRSGAFYPEPFKSRVGGRIKARLGDQFGLTNFGVNLTRLKPGAQSALRHCHTKQDEFVYILEGEATLITDAGKTTMTAGMCAGFKCANGDAHHLINESGADVVYLEVGDRTAGDSADYPDDDIQWVAGPDGALRPTKKDGTAF